MKKTWEEKIVEKIDRGEDLSEDELRSLVFVFGYLVKEIERAIRFGTHTESIIKLCDRYFKIEWEQNDGLELTNILHQPIEVKEVPTFLENFNE